jgi:hypothetical protein
MHTSMARVGERERKCGVNERRSLDFTLNQIGND